MGESDARQSAVLNLKAGEWVQVRSREEILATLDEHGRLDNMPFMSEMFKYCGQELRVSKRADKTCQYIENWTIRRVMNSVHLENARCDGSGHDGCEAGCLIFWKEAWLMRVGNKSLVALEVPRQADAVVPGSGKLCTIEDIVAASRSSDSAGETVYSCQATDVLKYTTHMRMWDPRQYVRDLRSGNLDSGHSGDSRSGRTLELILGIIQVVRAFVMSFFTEYKHINYPATAGTQSKTFVEKLDLQPGELVRVRSKEEIVATLDKRSRNQGLLFDGEMYPYCGGIYRVLRRVHHIVDEKTGKMATMKNACIVLEGVVCKSDYHRLCPRAIYPYWRENWLIRVAGIPAQAPTEQIVETCAKR